MLYQTWVTFSKIVSSLSLSRERDRSQWLICVCSPDKLWRARYTDKPIEKCLKWLMYVFLAELSIDRVNIREHMFDTNTQISHFNYITLSFDPEDHKR